MTSAASIADGVAKISVAALGVVLGALSRPLLRASGHARTPVPG